MLLALLLATDPAAAKDLRSRVGVGFHQQFGNVSALSVRFGLPAAEPTTNIQLELDAGVLAATSGTAWFAGGRALFGVVAEDNMNLYLGAGGGWMGGVDALRLQPVIATQFFLFGLENLGFSAEWGLNVDIAAETSAMTVGGAPAAAVHYYF